MRLTKLEQTSKARLTELTRKYVVEEDNYQYMMDICTFINSRTRHRLGYWNYVISRCISLMFEEGELHTGCRDFYKVIDILEKRKTEILLGSSMETQAVRRTEGMESAKAIDLSKFIRFISTNMRYEDKKFFVGVLETVKQKFFRKVVYQYEDK